jgi:D-alanyl-D-alanine carboxypeptidase
MPGTFRTNLVDAFDAQIDESMVDDFEALYAAGAAEGYYYWITYSYRSAADQSTLYDNYVSGLVESGMTEEEAKEEADRTVQDGGCSEYMTGLSIGLNTANDAFGETEEYQWLIENAADYGFVLRYPSDKESVTGVAFQPWRFRYVGKEHAQKMKELNLCLEEYVQYLNGQSGTPDNGSSTLS